MKVVRIITSILAALAGLGLFGYTIFLIIQVKSNLLFVVFPFVVIAATALSAGLVSTAKNPKFGNLLLTTFIVLLVAEAFNILMCLINMGVIPIKFLPSIDYIFINKGPAATGYILGFCIPGIVVSAAAKKGKIVPTAIACSLLVIVEGLIVSLNTWFTMHYGPTYIILFAVSIIAYVNALFLKKRDQRVQEIIKEAKKEEPVSQNSVPTTVEAQKSKVRVWVENGFTYSNRP